MRESGGGKVSSEPSPAGRRNISPLFGSLIECEALDECGGETSTDGCVLEAILFARALTDLRS